jgi:hypothetical protein
VVSIVVPLMLAALPYERGRGFVYSVCRVQNGENECEISPEFVRGMFCAILHVWVLEKGEKSSAKVNALSCGCIQVAVVYQIVQLCLEVKPSHHYQNRC